MLSTTTLPAAASPAICSPITEITVIEALPSPCFSTTHSSGRPLARAVRMKSCPSTSSMALRVNRVSAAIRTPDMAMVGMMKCAALPLPTTGSQFNV